MKIYYCFFQILLCVLLTACHGESTDSNDATSTQSIQINSQILNSASPYYNENIRGPSYTVFSIKNTAAQPANIDVARLDALSDPQHTIAIVNRVASLGQSDEVYGNYAQCAAYSSTTTVSKILPAQTCIVVVYGKTYNPLELPATENLTLSTSIGNNLLSKKFMLHNTTYIYLGGYFDQVGNSASVGENHAMLAACNNQTGQVMARSSHTPSGIEGNQALTCNNAFGNQAHNYANRWINTLYALPNGSLYVGGSFHTLGGASVPASHYLVAKCIPGFGCENALAPDVYASNGIIYSIIPDLQNNRLFIAGLFNTLGKSTALGSDKILIAQCAPGGDCTNALASSNNLQKNIISGANAYIFAMAYNPHLQMLYVATGNITQIGDAVANTGTLLAACPMNHHGPCFNPFSSNDQNANATIFGMTSYSDSTGHTQLYLGGRLTSIGGAETTTGKLLATCTITNTHGTCVNTLLPNGTVEGGNDLFTRMSYDANTHLLLLTGQYNSVYSHYQTGHAITNAVTGQAFPLICTPNAGSVAADCYNPLYGVYFHATSGVYDKNAVNSIAMGTQLSVSANS